MQLIKFKTTTLELDKEIAIMFVYFSHLCNVPGALFFFFFFFVFSLLSPDRCATDRDVATENDAPLTYPTENPLANHIEP